ncbi:unnamed protein product [Allacma fusca]|uniref:Uncharacterized protein n=1 Tax=Allacma fusca TaxID=39272 RepID=A0A8J2KAX2_9HEXA|nr:unnamed protein product [Allacma fusca]
MVGGILDVDHCDLKERDQTVTPHVFSPIWCVLLWRWLPSWSSELFNVHRPTHKKKVIRSGRIFFVVFTNSLTMDWFIWGGLLIHRFNSRALPL